MQFGVLAILLSAAVVCPAGVAAQGPTHSDTKIRGYITDVRSPNDFDIEDYRITRDHEVAVHLENRSADVAFTADDIRVGVEVEVRGRLNRITGVLQATSMRVDLQQFKRMKLTAFLDSPVSLRHQTDGTWAGEFLADGQTVVVTPATKVKFKAPLTAVTQLTPGTAVTFSGRRDAKTGKVLTDKVEFARNELERGEAKLWKSLTTDVTAAQELTGGELRINNVGNYTLFPSPDVQRYVADVGMQLIPPYQLDLASDDPSKIPFQFHVVVNDSANAFATPNGIVVVYSGLLELLENEAQLAAVLAHEIAHATYEHTWREQKFHRGKRIAIGIAGIAAAAFGMQGVADLALMINAGIISRHSRSLENQSDRVGLRYMSRAGYDPREAPAVWKLMARERGVQTSDLFWSSHEDQATRRSYLMSELKNNYHDIDYTTLRRNGREYRRIRAIVSELRKQGGTPQ
jgi:hypothetical protein